MKYYYCILVWVPNLSRVLLQCGIYGIDMGYRYIPYIYVDVVEQVGIYALVGQVLLTFCSFVHIPRVP